MCLYKFYRLGRDQCIFGLEELDLKTDRDALACAMEMAGEVAVEVWQDQRKIAYIAPSPWSFRGDIQRMRKSGELPARND